MDMVEANVLLKHFLFCRNGTASRAFLQLICQNDNLSGRQREHENAKESSQDKEQVG